MERDQTEEVASWAVVAAAVEASPWEPLVAVV